jgi:hypothetical protein
MSIQANLTGLSAGLWMGVVRIAFGDGTICTVQVALLVLSSTTTDSSSVHGKTIHAQTSGASSCNPNTDLVVVVQGPKTGFSGTVGTSVPLQVAGSDCAGNAVGNTNAKGDVLIQDQSGNLLADPPLIYQANGVWTATWAPASPASEVTLTARLYKNAGGTINILSGSMAITGTVRAAGADAPAVVLTVQNGASYQGTGQITPGAWVVLKGVQLADGTTLQQSTPYTPGLLTTQVTMQGQSLPLYYVSQNQVNALIPSELSADSQQLVVTRDGTQSAGIDVLVTNLEPGIFSLDSSGTGQGAILPARDSLQGRRRVPLNLCREDSTFRSTALVLGRLAIRQWMEHLRRVQHFHTPRLLRRQRSEGSMRR